MPAAGKAWALLALLAVLLTGAAEPERRLMEWLTTELGVDVSPVSIGRACATCPRGLLAARDFRQGEVILRIPAMAALQLDCNEQRSDSGGGGGGDGGQVESAAACARPLALRLLSDPAFNASWAPFLAVQPRQGELLAPETLDSRLRAMLQQADLEQQARAARRGAARVYWGTHVTPPLPPLPDLAPMGLADFLHLAALIESRSFGPLRGAVPASFLLPLVEMANHADPCPPEESELESEQEGEEVPPGGRQGAGGGGAGSSAAAEPDVPCAVASFPVAEGGAIVMRALRPIQKGQEVTFTYQQILHRPDMSLLIYGFTIPRQRPLLCAVDLPTFDPTALFAATPPDDRELYEDPGSLYISQAELERLRGILAALPTTEEADQALLEGGRVTDWREQAILQFRVLRKRALRQTIEKLQRALAERALRGEEAPAQGAADGGWLGAEEYAALVDRAAAAAAAAEGSADVEAAAAEDGAAVAAAAASDAEGTAAEAAAEAAGAAAAA